MENISRGSKSLYSLLGPAFSHKCDLNPAVQIHLFRLFTCCIVRSGISALAVRPTQAKPLTAFHRKTLRGFLHFTDKSPISAIHFILGEIPIVARLHRDVFSLLYSVWSNPQTKIYELVKHLLAVSLENSRTWSVHVRHLARLYGLPDPLCLLDKPPPAKSSWKEDVNTAITAYHERELRELAEENSKMKWFNVSMLSLQGKSHHLLQDVVTAHEVKKLRCQLKMLCGDFYCYSIKAENNGGSPHCRLCLAPVEDLPHVLTTCSAMEEARQAIVRDLEIILTIQPSESELYAKVLTNEEFNQLVTSEDLFTQFLVDPTSFNLPDKYRINFNDAKLTQINKITRHLCYSVNQQRLQKLRDLSQ